MESLKKKRAPRWATVALIATALGTIYLTPTFPALHRFARDTSLVPNGDVGDQPLFVWLIAKAKNSTSFSDFVTECSWSDTQCFDLRSTAQEMNMLYFLGRTARLFGAGERATITTWYFANLFLCLLAAFFFIRVISGNTRAALALAGLVSFQESLLHRIQGHITLVTWWLSATLLALQWLALREICEVDSIAGAKARAKGHLYPLLWAICFFVTVNFSFYYTAFDAVLAPAFLIAFLYAYRISPRQLIRKPGFFRAGIVVLAAVAIALASVRWAFTGPVDSKTFDRPDSMVINDSAKVRDFFLPNVDSSKPYSWLQPFHLVNDPASIGGRLEVLSYLGLTFLLALAFTLAVSYREKARSKSAPKTARTSAALFSMFLLAAFLTTAQGGLLVHELVRFLRCFNRVAPYVVLFGCAYIALIWRAHPVINRYAPLAVLVMFVLEFQGTSLLSPDLLRKMANVDRIAGAMKSVCARGSIRLDPPSAYYIMGPLGAYYAAEISGCRLSAVSGSGPLPQRPGFIAPPAAATLHWPGDYWGANPALIYLDPLNAKS